MREELVDIFNVGNKSRKEIMWLLKQSHMHVGIGL